MLFVHGVDIGNDAAFMIEKETKRIPDWYYPTALAACFEALKTGCFFSVAIAGERLLALLRPFSDMISDEPRRLNSTSRFFVPFYRDSYECQVSDGHGYLAYLWNILLM